MSLSEAQAAARLLRDGYNELPSQKKRNILSIFMGVIREPMLLLLAGGGLLYSFLGEPGDALMLLSFVFVVIGITVYQERKTEKTLDALRNLSSPRALVIRDGKERRIAGREVAVGDTIVLREGDRVPADARVVSCSGLSLDESLLTGESVPARKREWDVSSDGDKDAAPGGDDLPFVYSGTLVVGGHGIAEVYFTGINTRMGRIGRALQSIRGEKTLLQKETSRIVRVFFLAGMVLCSLVIILYGLTRGDWPGGILAGLTLGMAVLPEEFPVVLVIFLTLGAWRISRNNVLTRRAAAIETLGAASVLCVDKTGTLTLNSAELSGLFASGAYFWPRGEKSVLPDKFHDVLEYGILAGQKDPFDPIEKALKLAGELYLAGSEHIHNNWTLVKEYPLSKELFALSHVWESPDRKNYIIAAKGSPEAVADLCHLSGEARRKLSGHIETLAGKSLRVLGVARAAFRKTELPEEQHDFIFEFMGLLGFSDPVRPAVPQAIKEAYEAGIRVIMITGDYPGTAVNIASQIGLKNPGEYITGQEVATLSSGELKVKIRDINIFPRMVPEQKMAVIDALKANGEVVAMTGDGVNDAPALKSAHIGIAMGKHGTDVAREASALVLLDDDFSSIVDAVGMGRRIFFNLKKAVAYIFAVHIPVAGMAFLPVFLHMPIVLLPAHIAFLELIIDPACSTVFESHSPGPGNMKVPPRRLQEPLFDRRTLVFSIFQGLGVLAVVFALYIYALRGGAGADAARTAAFIALVLSNLMLIFANLGGQSGMISVLKEKNRALRLVIFGALSALAAILSIPLLRKLFHLSAVSARELSLSLAAAALALLWLELLKFLMRRGGKPA
ncbi:MAG: cation-translocating P-type ATPase [Candidatus Omnitrophica bacterium]|nr:cation-translocating P-type ATPase [Candidatus Omnitrophota bacterium]